MATARQCNRAHAVACTEPTAHAFDATHTFKAIVVLLCLRNGNFDAQVTNRRDRSELQRTVVAHKTHLQQCLADFCSLELVHGVHCPRWASRIAYLDEIVLCSSAAHSKQSSRKSLIQLLCCMLLHVPVNELHVPANRLHVPADWLHVPANWLDAVALYVFDPKHIKYQHKQHQLMPVL